MGFITKDGFSLEDFYQVIKKYDFPITDVKHAVDFLNDLPKNCNVDLPESVKFDNIREAVLADGEYNLTILCDNYFGDPNPYRIHLLFKDISVVSMDGCHKAIIVRSGKASSESDMYLTNDLMIIHPTDADLYNNFPRSYSI